MPSLGLVFGAEKGVVESGLDACRVSQRVLANYHIYCMLRAVAFGKSMLNVHCSRAQIVAGSVSLLLHNLHSCNGLALGRFVLLQSHPCVIASPPRHSLQNQTSTEPKTPLPLFSFSSSCMRTHACKFSDLSFQLIPPLPFVFARVSFSSDHASPRCSFGACSISFMPSSNLRRLLYFCI